MEASAFFITAVFFLGVSVGGLLVSLQRQCAIDRIRSEFNRELALAVDQASKSARPAGRIVPENSSMTQTSQADANFEDVADDELCWENLRVPLRGEDRPHAGI